MVTAEETGKMKNSQATAEALKNLASSLAIWHVAAAETHYSLVAAGHREAGKYATLGTDVAAAYWASIVNTAGHPTGDALKRVTMTVERIASVAAEAQEIGKAMIREFPEQYPHFIAARKAEKFAAEPKATPAANRSVWTVVHKGTGSRVLAKTVSGVEVRRIERWYRKQGRDFSNRMMGHSRWHVCCYAIGEDRYSTWGEVLEIAKGGNLPN